MWKQFNNKMTSQVTILNKQFSFDDETIFATAKEIAEIFNVAQNTISEHIKNILVSQELNENETCRIFRNVSNQPVKHYSLDMIIAVGYRVNSFKATKFRTEATKVLKEYLTKKKIKTNHQIQLPDINSDFILQIANQMKQLEEQNKQLNFEVKHLEDQKQILDGKVAVLSTIHKVEHDLRGLQKCGKDLGLNPNKFIIKLKNLGFLTKTTPPMPYQKYIDNRFFVNKVVSYKIYQGDALIEKATSQTYVTEKGYIYFQDIIAKNSQEWADIATPEMKIKLKNLINKTNTNFKN